MCIQCVLSRRAFIQTGFMAIAAALTGIFPRFADASQRVPTSTPLSEFGYGDVQLAPGLPETQYKQTLGVLMGLSNDSLLMPFRLRTGLPAPGDDLGGWYGENPNWGQATVDEATRTQSLADEGFAPGHSFGQWLSALSRAYAIGGDSNIKGKVHDLILGYAPTISAKFYSGLRFPGYTMDKLVCGLSDAYHFTGDPVALDMLRLTVDTALPLLPDRALDRGAELQAWTHGDASTGWDELYTLPENLFIASERGFGTRYRDLAKRYLKDDTWFNPLAQGKNVLDGRHAYSYVNSLSSAMQAYLQLGSKKHLRAAINAFQMLQDQSFATGGWGPDETLVAVNSDTLAESLTRTHQSFETPCGAYAHFKLMRYLLRVLRQGCYGDSMELVMYNTVLGAKPLQSDGSAFYYSDYTFAGRKVYHHNKWTCCSGTLPQIAADYRISAYFFDAQGVYVNLYMPSTLNWKQHGAAMSLKQSSNYPLAGDIRFDLTASSERHFALRLRIPAWAGDLAVLRLNGKRISLGATAGGFASVSRMWKSGDRIELELPLSLRLEPLDSRHPDTVALLRGPLVLFAITDSPLTVTRSQLLAAKQVSDTEWHVETNGGTISLVPFFTIQDQSYTTYVRVV
jgi:uncharacterized protein